MYGDENRISQFLINFLSNSFKLTPAYGDITVELKVINDEDINRSKNIKPEID